MQCKEITKKEFDKAYQEDRPKYACPHCKKGLPALTKIDDMRMLARMRSHIKFMHDRKESEKWGWGQGLAKELYETLAEIEDGLEWLHTFPYFKEAKKCKKKK